MSTSLGKAWLLDRSWLLIKLWLALSKILDLLKNRRCLKEVREDDVLDLRTTEEDALETSDTTISGGHDD